MFALWTLQPKPQSKSGKIRMNEPQISRYLRKSLVLSEIRAKKGTEQANWMFQFQLAESKRKS